MERTKRRAKSIKVIVIVCLVAAVLLAAGLIAGNYFYNYAINANSDAIGNPNADDTDESGQLADGDTDSCDFFETHTVLDNNISASLDGTALYARSIENPDTDVWVIIAHCYGGDGTTMESYAEKFYEMGYSTLLPDLRGHGKSGGNYRGMGWDDRLDIIDWVDYINENYENAEIVLFGVSMGADAVMMASGESLPSNVKAVIEDCGYSSIYEEFKVQIKSMFGLPSFPLLNFAGAVTQLRAGYNFINEGDAVSQVAKSVTPTLFIHGDEDTFVPLSMMEKLYDAASCEREKLIVPGAGHAQSADTDPQLYWDTVKDFLDRYLDAASTEDAA